MMTPRKSLDNDALPRWEEAARVSSFLLEIVNPPRSARNTVQGQQSRWKNKFTRSFPVFDPLQRFHTEIP